MRLDFPNVNGDINVYMDVMRAICGDTAGKSMIDLGCNTAPNTPQLGFEKRMYIDILPRILDHPGEQQFFHQMDVLKIGTLIQWDVAICSDCIEHLTLSDGVVLRKKMEDISDRQVFFTPTTDLFGMAEEGNKDPEAHRSLWTPDDMFVRSWYAKIVFPDYHKVWNGGAFFFWSCKNIQQDFERVKEILLTKPWAK